MADPPTDPRTSSITKLQPTTNCSTGAGRMSKDGKGRPAAHTLPEELLRAIFNEVQDWELATTLRIPHSIPITSPWQEQATPLDRAILNSSESLVPVTIALSKGCTKFTQWGTRVMCRFSYVHLLDFFLKHDSAQLKEECSAILPVVASAWGRLEVLKWAISSDYKLAPAREVMREAMDEASRHGQVQEDALSSASFQGKIGALEWWKHSGRPLKIGNVLDFASMQGTTISLDWWAASGLPAPYSKAALWNLSRTGNVALLDWWKASRFSLVYDKEVIIVATRYGQTDVLSWWLDSGLDIEYRFFDIEEALEDSIANKEASELWWRARGYDTVLSTSEWTRTRNFRTDDRD